MMTSGGDNEKVSQFTVFTPSSALMAAMNYVINLQSHQDGESAMMRDAAGK